MRKLSLVTILIILAICPSLAETVDVKYRGPVKLDSFDCSQIDRSSFVNRVCYNAKKSYLVVKLSETYYHYCEVDLETIKAFLTAPSMGRFYNSSIKDSGSGGKFSCKNKSVPSVD